MLNGDLEPEIDPAGERLWRVKDLQILPGLDGPFTTLACLTMGPEAAQAVVGSPGGNGEPVRPDLPPYGQQSDLGGRHPHNEHGPMRKCASELLHEARPSITVNALRSPKTDDVVHA